MFRLLAFKIHTIIKKAYCFNWLPWTYTRSSHWEVFLEINLNQKTLKFYTSWVHWKNQCRSTVRKHALLWNKQGYQHSTDIFVNNIFNLLPWCFLHTQIMLIILILINVQYLQNVVFSFQKGSSGQNHSLSDSHHPIEKSPPANFPSPYPLILFGKSWKKFAKPSFFKFACLFQVKFSFTIDNIFFQSSIMT